MELVSERRTGWFQAMRFPDMPGLVRMKRNAFILAYLIAYRARWSAGFNPLGLDLGEAAIDYENWGLSRQEFRTAQAFLEKNQLATFRPTSVGTVGKLIDSRLFCVLPGDANQLPNRNPTTNVHEHPNKTLTLTLTKTGAEKPRLASQEQAAHLDQSQGQRQDQNPEHPEPREILSPSKPLPLRERKLLRGGGPERAPADSAQILAFAKANLNKLGLDDPSDTEERNRLLRRFMRYNDIHNWEIGDWRSALLAFAASSAEYGVSDVPGDFPPKNWQPDLGS